MPQVLDNTRFHRTNADELVEICRRQGVVVKFLAPFNPQSMPIENFFPSVKSLLRVTEHRETVVAAKFNPIILRAFFETVGTPALCQRPNAWLRILLSHHERQHAAGGGGRGACGGRRRWSSPIFLLRTLREGVGSVRVGAFILWLQRECGGGVHSRW
jgi:hypothetical protein